METVGWTSLLPPLLAIVLAVWTRRVILSLFFGLWLGVSMLHRWNPFTGFRALLEDFAFVQVTDPWNASVLVLMLCIGGFVRLIVRSGAAQAFAAALSRLVTNSMRAHGAVWFSGIVVFFSDSANPLILGPLFGPLFDRLRLSREKLAYLIDSTASAVCILVPITSWAAYVLSLLAREHADLEVDEVPMAAYLRSIPFQFYAFASLLLVPMIGLMGIEYGPMRAAELECRKPAARAASPAPPPVAELEKIPFSRARSGVLALCAVAMVILIVLLGTGGFPDVGIFAALTAGKSVCAVTSGFVAGALVLGGLLLVERAMALREIATHWGRGAASMGAVLVILTLAWSLGAACDALGTGTYVAGAVERAVSPILVPALVFLVGAVISFATGSAWGCYAILMPIALPLAVQMNLPIHVVLAAVLSGGIFGDHASPISDTTILSSIGAGCTHVEHVRTQLPYASTAGVAALAGFLLAAVWPSAWVLGPVLALLFAMALLFHRLADRADPG
jgi:Na+/H+ antiporter NhaC